MGKSDLTPAVKRQQELHEQAEEERDKVDRAFGEWGRTVAMACADALDTETANVPFDFCVRMVSAIQRKPELETLWRLGQLDIEYVARLVSDVLSGREFGEPNDRLNDEEWDLVLRTESNARDEEDDA